MKNVSLLLAIIAALGLSAAAQTPAGEISEADVYLARDDGEGAPGDEATEFSVSDIPIYCVVRLGSADPATVKMYLVAVNVKGVRPESRVVSASYTTTEGQTEVYFNGRPEKLWHAGAYRADIFIDGKPFRSLDFIVRSRTVEIKGNSFIPAKPKPKPKPKPRPRQSGN